MTREDREYLHMKLMGLAKRHARDIDKQAKTGKFDAAVEARLRKDLRRLEHLAGELLK